MRAAALGCLALALAGCAGMAHQAPPAPDPAAVARAQAVEAQARQLTAFIAAQRGLADEAEARGEWSRAAWAWEAVVAVSPGDSAAATRLQRARQASESLATLRVQQARLALQLNELDNARALFMRALVAKPDHPDAVEGLRGLERERVRQQQLAQPTRTAPARGNRPLRAEIEHASLLAAQGELAMAIAVLQPLAQGRNADPAARRSLSDLYLAQAEALHPQDTAKALAALQQSLQMDSRNARAASLQREWRRPPARPAPARATPARPASPAPAAPANPARASPPAAASPAAPAASR